MRHHAPALNDPEDVSGNAEHAGEFERWRRDDEEGTGRGVEALDYLGMSGVLVDDRDVEVVRT